MRIGIVLGSSIQSGGVFQHEIAILESLKLYASDCGHQFFVFSYDFQFDTESFECEHLKCIEVKKRPVFFRSIDYSLRILMTFFHRQSKLSEPICTAINKYDIDLMYYMGSNHYCLIIDLPYILTVWDSQHRSHPEFPEVCIKGEWRNRENLYREGTGKAYAIIVDEKAGMEEVKRYYNAREEKIFVLPYVPSIIKQAREASFESIQEKYGIPSDYIFYPAQFWPHKNHVAILKAIKILKDKYNTYISAVFTGSDKGNLSYIKKLTNDFGLTKQAFFLGFVPDEEIPPLYKSALALVMPTYFGPSNIPVYEAFVYKCPVITSDICGIREQVGDAGILVDPSDFGALSEAILKIYRDKTLRDILIINGTKKSQSWTGKDYIENLIKIIDSFSSTRLCWGNRYKYKNT